MGKSKFLLVAQLTEATVFEILYVRPILVMKYGHIAGYTQWNHKRNEEMLEEFKIEPTLSYIQQINKEETGSTIPRKRQEKALQNVS